MPTAIELGRLSPYPALGSGAVMNAAQTQVAHLNPSRPHAFSPTARPPHRFPDSAGGSTPHTPKVLESRMKDNRFIRSVEALRRIARSFGGRRGSHCDGAGNGRCSSSEEMAGTAAAGGRDPACDRTYHAFDWSAGQSRSGIRIAAATRRRWTSTPAAPANPKPRGEPARNGRRNDRSR